MLTKRYKSKKQTKQTAKARKAQRGGVGFKYEVGACAIGGRPPVVATSDCPGVGPGSADFANALYGLPPNQLGGTKRSPNSPNLPKPKRQRVSKSSSTSGKSSSSGKSSTSGKLSSSGPDSSNKIVNILDKYISTHLKSSINTQSAMKKLETVQLQVDEHLSKIYDTLNMYKMKTKLTAKTIKDMDVLENHLSYLICSIIHSYNKMITKQLNLTSTSRQTGGLDPNEPVDALNELYYYSINRNPLKEDLEAIARRINAIIDDYTNRINSMLLAYKPEDIMEKTRLMGEHSQFLQDLHPYYNIIDDLRQTIMQDNNDNIDRRAHHPRRNILPEHAAIFAVLKHPPANLETIARRINAVLDGYDRRIHEAQEDVRRRGHIDNDAEYDLMQIQADRDKFTNKLKKYYKKIRNLQFALMQNHHPNNEGQDSHSDYNMASN